MCTILLGRRLRTRFKMWSGSNSPGMSATCRTLKAQQMTWTIYMHDSASLNLAGFPVQTPATAVLAYLRRRVGIGLHTHLIVRLSLLIQTASLQSSLLR